MSAASDAISDLDAELAETGEDVVLRRIMPNAPDLDRPHRAFVRGYRPDELVGGIMQGDTLVAMSPTNLPAEFLDLRRNDRIVIAGRARKVEFVDPVTVGGALVRLNALVRG